MKSIIFNQVLALATLNLARADDWWDTELSHKCHQAKACEDSTFYFNELACECFKKEICSEEELGCDFGLERDPRQKCACTNEPPKYPDWATEQDKINYANEGILRAASRPDNWALTWRQYPKEENRNKVSKCYSESQYWNELAGECFSMIMCSLWCDKPGEELDTISCECRDKDDIRDDYYPEWATPYDIQESKRQGQLDFENRLTVCPYEELEGEQDCNGTKYFDELACKWFKKNQCKRGCDEGYSLSPRSFCKCIPDKKIAKMYPKWADEWDRKESRLNGVDNKCNKKD